MLLKLFVGFSCLVSVVHLQGSPQEGGTLDDLIQSVFNNNTNQGPGPSPAGPGPQPVNPQPVNPLPVNPVDRQPLPDPRPAANVCILYAKMARERPCYENSFRLSAV